MKKRKHLSAEAGGLRRKAKSSGAPRQKVADVLVGGWVGQGKVGAWRGRRGLPGWGGGARGVRLGAIWPQEV